MIRKPRKTVGLIGLGIIGSRAAAGLRAAGFQTFVWNRTPQPAPNFLASPADVAAAAEIIQIFVADAQALFDVLEAMREKLTAKHLIIASGTFGPEATVEASKFVQETGAHFLDAPFTGSKAAAEKHQLVYYIGGDDASFLRAKPVLEANAKAIVRIGTVGDAAIIKVVTNMIAAVSIQALAEALAIVRKAGLPEEVLGYALEHNACKSGTMDLKLPKMLSGDYEPHFSLKHMFKDVQLGIQMANALEIDVPATSVTAGVMFGGIKHGWADLDFASTFKIYEDLRGRHPAIEAPPAEHAEFHPAAGSGDVADTDAESKAGAEETGATKKEDDPQTGKSSKARITPPKEAVAPAAEESKEPSQAPKEEGKAEKEGDGAKTKTPSPTVENEKPSPPESAKETEGEKKDTASEVAKDSPGGGGESSISPKPEVEKPGAPHSPPGASEPPPPVPGAESDGSAGKS